MVEYEDELDLLAVVVTNGDEGDGSVHVQLHDNQSGELLRTVELAEPWDEVSDGNLPTVSLSLRVCGLTGAVLSRYRHIDTSCALTKRQWFTLNKRTITSAAMCINSKLSQKKRLQPESS